jgi:hypothetical protein
MLHALIDRRKPRRGSAQRPDDPNIRCPRVRDLLAFLVTLSEPEPDGPPPLDIRRRRPEVWGIQEALP